MVVVIRGGTRLPSECDYLPKYSSLWRLSINNRHKREHSAVDCAAKCHPYWWPTSVRQPIRGRVVSQRSIASTTHPHICQLVSLSSPMKRPLVGHYHPETPQRQLASHLNWLENPRRREGKDEEFLVFFLRRWALDFLLCSPYLVAHNLRKLQVLINSFSIQQRLWSLRLY